MRYAVALAACLWTTALATAADHVEEFTKARPALQRQLRSGLPSDRIAALERLGDFPIADATRMIATCLKDDDESVCESAYQTLLKQRGSLEVCDTLLTIAKKELGQNEDVPSAAMLASVLLTSNLPSVRRDSGELLERSKPELVVALADELSQYGNDTGAVALARMGRNQAFVDSFAIRRAVVDGLTRIPRKSAVEGLIELLPAVRGEARADAVEHLTNVTQQVFGLEARSWQIWWEGAKSGFEFPARVQAKPYRSISLGMSSEYYGLPLFAERLVFVIDVSGSMSGPRIMAAKRELIDAIESLSQDVSFSIVAYNQNVDVWQQRLMKVNDAVKRNAVAYVESLGSQSNTASYDALEAAMQFDVEAIYFMSDGDPNAGKITTPVDIIAAITAGNLSRRISIYTIGIAAGVPGSPLDEFLRVLAMRNGGVYRRVDQ